MKNLNGYKIIQDYLSRTGELWHTEVFDVKGKRIALKDHISKEITKTYYLEGKILYDEDGEIDIAYKETSTIDFGYTKKGLEIVVRFDHSDPYTSVERFVRDWQELLPFMTSEILTYFINEEPLIPPIEL